MPAPNPARAGLAAVLRRPAIVAIEIAWRWTFGAAALLLVAFVWLEFLRGIEISEAEYALTHSAPLLAVADAIARVLAANYAPLLRAAAVLLPGVALLWVIASSVGRALTLRLLLEPARALRYSALVGLSFFRAALALAALGGYVAAAILAGLAAGGPERPDVGVFIAVFFPMMFLVVGLWAVLNWFLSVAPLFAVRDGDDTFAAFAHAVRWFRRRPAVFTSIGTLYGVLRLVALVVVTVLCFMLAAAVDLISVAGVAVGIALFSLLYFALADLLYVARLAAYAELMREIPVETRHAASLVAAR